MGMKETVSMRYEICFDDDSQQGQGGLRGEQPWSAFSSFVARDYDDLMAKSTAYIPPPQQITSENNHPTASQMTSQNPQIASQNPNTTQKNGVVFGGGDENPMENGEKKRGASADDQRFIRPAAETPASSGKSPHFSRSSAEKRPQSNSNCSNALLSPQPQQPTLADEECSGFADQIRAIRNRKPTNLGRPKRQVKLILDGPRVKNFIQLFRLKINRLFQIKNLKKA
jgi:hypothetical protein